MTLQQFALVVGAEPKWILNAGAVVRVGRGGRYSRPAARRLALARAIVDGAGVPLARAYRLAGAALRAVAQGERETTLSLSPAGLTHLRVETYRVLAAVAAREARVATMYEPTRRGRKRSTRRDPLRAAREYGLDLSLLRDNLRRTPAERLGQLDAMAAFRQRVRRAARP